MSIVRRQKELARPTASSKSSFLIRWRRIPNTKSVVLVIPIAPETRKSRTKTLKKAIFFIEKGSETIKKLNISIEKLNIFIEKFNISIEKLIISIEKPIVSIEKFNISIEKVPFFIEKGTKKQENGEHFLG